MLACRSNRLSYTALHFTILSFGLGSITKSICFQKILATESLELSIPALLERFSNWLSYMALQFTLFWVLVFVKDQISILTSNKLTIESLELAILAMLAQRSNQLSYTALHFTLFWVLVFLQHQINIMVSKNGPYRGLNSRSSSC